jgi:hypothetical protein
MRDRRPAEITVILTIGIILIALIIYFSPKNPYCFQNISSAEGKVRAPIYLYECMKGGPLEDSERQKILGRPG